MIKSLRLAVAAAFVTTVAAAASAQDSRADVIAQAQAEKAQHLAPYVPSRAEEIAAQVQQRLLGDPSGFYPWFDSVYGGGGFTMGAGYRRFTGDRTHWSIAGLYSTKNYKLIEAAETSPGHWSGRLDLHAIAGWRGLAQRFHQRDLPVERRIDALVDDTRGARLPLAGDAQIGRAHV